MFLENSKTRNEFLNLLTKNSNTTQLGSFNFISKKVEPYENFYP